MAQQDAQRQNEFNKVNVQKLSLIPLDADPLDLGEGDMWCRGDTHVVHLYLNGVIETIAVVV